MDRLLTIVGVLSFIASVCTIWMFVEDRFRKFRLKMRRKKMKQ